MTEQDKPRRTRSRAVEPQPELSDTLLSISERTSALTDAVRDIEQRAAADAERMWAVLQSISGLEGFGRGMSEVVEVLKPLRLLVPPTTAQPLEEGVAEAIVGIRVALAQHPTPALPPDRLPTEDWDLPVYYIGQVRPNYYNPSGRGGRS